MRAGEKTGQQILKEAWWKLNKAISEIYNPICKISYYTHFLIIFAHAWKYLIFPLMIVWEDYTFLQVKEKASFRLVQSLSESWFRSNMTQDFYFIKLNSNQISKIKSKPFCTKSKTSPFVKIHKVLLDNNFIQNLKFF